MDRSVTPPKRVTSPTWGTRPPCKQTLSKVQMAGSDFKEEREKKIKQNITKQNKAKQQQQNTPNALGTRIFSV